MIVVPASPSLARQAPNHITLGFNTTFQTEKAPYSTEAIAQEYFEPGVNTKLNRRRKPKADYTMPTDAPTVPFGFVPTNQFSTDGGLTGDTTPQIKITKSVPGDLLEMFQRINADSVRNEQAIKEGKREEARDVGTRVANDMLKAMKEKSSEDKFMDMIRKGFSEIEANAALQSLRLEEALKEARKPASPQPLNQTLEEALGIAKSIADKEGTPLIAFARKEKKPDPQAGAIERFLEPR